MGVRKVDGILGKKANKKPAKKNIIDTSKFEELIKSLDGQELVLVLDDSRELIKKNPLRKFNIQEQAVIRVLAKDLREDIDNYLKEVNEDGCNKSR